MMTHLDLMLQDFVLLYILIARQNDFELYFQIDQFRYKLIFPVFCIKVDRLVLKFDQKVILSQAIKVNLSFFKP